MGALYIINIMNNCLIDCELTNTKKICPTILNNIGDEIMIINKDGRIIYVNDATVKGLGFTKEYILSKFIVDFFREKMSISTWKKTHYKRLKETKKPISLILERVVNDNRLETIDITAVYIEYESSEYILSVARNITKQVELQNEIKKTEGIFRLLNEQAAESICSLDLYGNLIHANRACESLFNIPLEKAIGKHFTAFTAKNSLYKALTYFNRVKKGEKIIHEELDIVDVDGNIKPIEITAAPVYRDDKIIQIQAIIRDVTSAKQLKELLIESEKMKALQHFVYGTTQEIQYPIKAILDNCDNLVNKYKQRDFEYIGYKEYKDIIRSLELMRDQVKSCFNTTQRLLTLNRKKAGVDNQFSDMNSVMHDSLKMLQYHFDTTDIKLVLRLNKKLPLVTIGSIELNQVISNILTNAIQSMPKKGNITIITKYVEENKMVQFECRDEGIGILPDNLSRVFEPFFTTKFRSLDKNSGLGLTIVYSVVKAYQGKIAIKSNYKKGTVVTVSLPSQYK